MSEQVVLNLRNDWTCQLQIGVLAMEEASDRVEFLESVQYLGGQCKISPFVVNIEAIHMRCSPCKSAFIFLCVVEIVDGWVAKLPPGRWVPMLEDCCLFQGSQTSRRQPHLCQSRAGLHSAIWLLPSTLCQVIILMYNSTRLLHIIGLSIHFGVIVARCVFVNRQLFGTWLVGKGL